MYLAATIEASIPHRSFFLPLPGLPVLLSSLLSSDAGASCGLGVYWMMEATTAGERKGTMVSSSRSNGLASSIIEMSSSNTEVSERGSVATAWKQRIR
ncbi:unnamed protein product [Linum trigynum]|uniref:Uncharacterized protein n=1 Tax=Linum trigynum TaxID=586398 RepID=A0AAV2FWG9_9ROSI